MRFGVPAETTAVETRVAVTRETAKKPAAQGRVLHIASLDEQHACVLRAPAWRPAINLARLDLVSMHLLVECAAALSISVAARHCNLSVMGASERLRRLEESLGRRLFHRHRHGLEITAAGLVATRCASSMITTAHQLLTDVSAARESAPTRAENPGRRGTVALPPQARRDARPGLQAPCS
jgi:molybdenum-dependent DNA-binding transcriptional regulator ModE